MIQLSRAAKAYGHKLLFADADLLITAQDRVGLVGANGTGKSTLLRILVGLESVDSGTFTAARGISAGYLPQEGLQLSGRTVLAECMSVFARLESMEQELEKLTSSMAEFDPTSAEYQEVAERYHRVEHEFRTHDGYAREAQVGTVLAGLGFRAEDWQRDTREFSGGWQMRIALGKLLLERPNLLLLDEPTNHLDLESRNWLEQYLTDYPYAFVLISHDRYFLDVTVKRVIEIWNRKISSYKGNYEKYLAAKQQRLEQLEAAYRNQRERIEQLEVFINRFRYQATKAKQVQSRIKELERMTPIELPEEERTIHFSFPQPSPSGRIVAEFAGITKCYGEKKVLEDVSFIVERGDRIALVGVNGAGKSTLIKLLAGTEPLTGGTFRLGHNAQADYFAQDQYKQLDGNARLLDDLGRVSPSSRESELRSLLGCFLFSGDDVFKRIGVLSGGERNRYALLRMLLYPANFLLLDEPTNHLDMRAKDVLLEALCAYTGTVVFVSHDRYFIDKLATRVFEIADRRVEIYPGNYEDFIWRKQGGASKLEQELRGTDWPATTREAGSAARQEGAGKAKRLNPLKRRQLQDRAEQLEQEISSLEAAIAERENCLQKFISADETSRLTRELEQNRAALLERIAEWEQIGQQLESQAH
ncbi:MAG: ABC-F family ATP-binding cassette domain-containing protein [Acidobacteria bacterium]|nr:ABC-F family ATP-binding cassette domain-containing protein [Acidobacteriota bacterium]MBV9623018.1 ABC-F family ATP-binding cassette domain-containing protein [Acidobacteriota bacterium]